MTAFRWKPDKNSRALNSQPRRRHREHKPVALAFVNIESPAQLTDAENQRKVRQHVAVTRRALEQQASALAAEVHPSSIPARGTCVPSPHPSDDLPVVQSVGVPDETLGDLAMRASVIDNSMVPRDAAATTRQCRNSSRTAGRFSVQFRLSLNRKQAAVTAIVFALYYIRCAPWKATALFSGEGVFNEEQREAGDFRRKELLMRTLELVAGRYGIDDLELFQTLQSLTQSLRM
ncbi:hypothetical protein PWT90_00471 [Aphanocladium album]|nr:hypothetical protein PWT90_00471 [Aphanocladium album]